MRNVPPLTGLSATLRSILNEWDPIGVVPDAPADEYDCMIPKLTSLVEQGAGEAIFERYLTDELSHHFGLPTRLVTPKVTRELARLAASRRVG